MQNSDISEIYKPSATNSPHKPRKTETRDQQTKSKDEESQFDDTSQHFKEREYSTLPLEEALNRDGTSPKATESTADHNLYDSIVQVQKVLARQSPSNLTSN